jgi:hypothetical protein
MDLASDDGLFLARILGAVARKESDDKSRRIKRKHEELAAAGQPAGGGTRPFGYEPGGRVVREEEAQVIRDCARRFLAGESLRSLCADLNERGVVTSTGKRWATTSLRRVLGSGRISGQREHHGEIVARADWPAIISPKQTATIRAILSDPARRTNHTARSYLLTQLLRCGQCGERMVARPRAGGQRRYICAKGPNYSGCGKTFVVADDLEQLISDAVLYRLDSPELEAAIKGRPLDDAGEAAQQAADAAEAKLAELAAAYANDEITMAEWRVARGPIEQRRSASRKALARSAGAAALDGHIGQGSQLRETWPNLPLTRQTAIVAAVLDHAVIGPGQRGLNRFDPSRVTPVWRT